LKSNDFDDFSGLLSLFKLLDHPVEKLPAHPDPTTF
jgi:hypothetical protein